MDTEYLWTPDNGPEVPLDDAPPPTLPRRGWVAAGAAAMLALVGVGVAVIAAGGPAQAGAPHADGTHPAAPAATFVGPTAARTTPIIPVTQNVVRYVTVNVPQVSLSVVPVKQIQIVPVYQTIPVPAATTTHAPTPPTTTAPVVPPAPPITTTVTTVPPTTPPTTTTTTVPPTTTPPTTPVATSTTPVSPTPTAAATCMPHSTITAGTATCGAGTPHPTGTTALCNDGTYSTSQTPQGTCSNNNGVEVWYY